MQNTYDELHFTLEMCFHVAECSTRRIGKKQVILTFAKLLNSKTRRRTFTRLALTVTWTPSFQFQPIIRSILFGDLAPSVISSETQSKTIYRSATCSSSTLFNCEYA